MFLAIVKKFKFKFKINNKKIFFLISINLIPFLLILLTSIITGAKIRTMWMTPFYLFLGTLFLEIFRKNIDIKKIKKFSYFFLFFFFFFFFFYFLFSFFFYI